MPGKRSDAGFFVAGEKTYETFLKCKGWKSEYPSIQKLLDHLARRIKSEGSRDSYLRWLYGFCKATKKDPDEIARMSRSWLRDREQEFINASGKASPATGNLAKAALSAFFKANGFDGDIKEPIVLKGFFSPARKSLEMNDYVPSKEEILRMANSGKTNNQRDRAIILFLYTSGLRQGTLRALRFRDIKQELAAGEIPLKIPVYPEMKKVLPDACKGNVPYYTFVAKEALEALKAHLREQGVSPGDVSSDDVVFNGWNHNRFLKERRRPLSRSSLDLIVKNVAQRAGIERWEDVRPHCLRKAFESALREDMSDGRKLDEKTQEFLMGHILPGSQENYFDRSKTDRLRQEYSKVRFLPEAGSKVDMTSQLKREILLSVASYSEEEIDKLGLMALPDDQ